MKINWEKVSGFFVIVTIVVAVGAALLGDHGLSVAMMIAAIFWQSVENWFAIKAIERRLG